MMPNRFASITPLPSLTKNRCRINVKVSTALPVKSLFRSSFKPIASTTTNTTNNNTITVTTTPTYTAHAQPTSQAPLVPSAPASSTSTSAANAFSTVVASLHSTLSTTLTQQNHNNNNNSKTTTPHKSSLAQHKPPPPPFQTKPTIIIAASENASAFGFLPKLGAKLQQLNRDILRPASFVPSAGANSRNPANGDGDMADMIVAISPKFALTPKRKPAAATAIGAETVAPAEPANAHMNLVQ